MHFLDNKGVQIDSENQFVSHSLAIELRKPFGFVESLFAFWLIGLQHENGILLTLPVVAPYQNKVEEKEKLNCAQLVQCLYLTQSPRVEVVLCNPCNACECATFTKLLH